MDPPLNRAIVPVMQRLTGLLYFQESSAAELTAERKTVPVGGDAEAESMKKYTDNHMCNSVGMEKYVKLCRSDPSAGNSIYASPVEAGSLEGLPMAYIGTAELDCLRDEGVLYAGRLRQFGAAAGLNNTEGTIHGFDIVPDSPIVRECVDRRIAFLRQTFGK